MKYRPLGRTGLELSELSLGSYVTFGDQVDLPVAKRLMTLAYDAGVNFFDNAESYEYGESERIMGQALEELGWDRDSFCVSSKVFFGSKRQIGPTQRGLHRKHVVEACHQALRRLRVDYLDLYLCHRADPETPIEETVRAMHGLIQQGKVLYWGTSEWSAGEIRAAHAVARQHGLTPPSMEQPQYNMLNRDRVEVEYRHLYRRYGMGITTWAPLRSGLLTGKYNDGVPADARFALPGHESFRDDLDTATGRRVLAVVADLANIAREAGTSMPRLAIAWCLLNQNVGSVILGASRPEQLEENLGAIDAMALLTPDVVRRIERCLRRLPRWWIYRVPGARKLAAMARAMRDVRH